MVALLLSSAGGSLAQTVNTSMWVTDGHVNSVVSDGSTIYLGGYFGTVGPATGCAVAIDASTGAVQQPYPRVFGPGLFSVQAVAPDGSGGWYLGGVFTTVRGVPRNNLAHLDAAGNVTPWNPNANNAVRSLVVSGSTVYVGGDFGSIGGQPRNGIAALDAATGAATAWNPNANGGVYAMVVSGNTVYAGGVFTNIGGQARNRIAAIDATTGVPSAWDPNANEYVLVLAESGGTVYAGGTFTNIGGQPRQRIAALDAVSGAATAWNPDAQSNFVIFPGNPPYYPDVIQPASIKELAIVGSTVYAGGFFTSIGGQTRRDLAAIDAASGAATAWNPAVVNVTANPGVESLVVSGGTVYAGGPFLSIGGQSRSWLAAVDASSGVATAWSPYVIGNVNALAVSGGTVYVGGSFTSAGAQPRKNVAALDATTGAATAWNPSADDVVFKLALGGGTVYAGGRFSSIGGQARSKLAALDATTGAATAWDPNPQLSGPGENLAVRALMVSGSTVYVGGSFTSIGGQLRNHLAEIDATTGDATAWDPNVQWPGANSPYAQVYGLALGVGTVYAGGSFTKVGSLFRNNIAAIDATTGVATPWNPNIQWSDPKFTYVDALEVQPGTVYAGGRFTMVGGQPRNYLCAINATTGAATAWNPNADNTVGDLVSSGGMLYVSGGFSNIGGQPRSGIAALDPTTGVVNAWNPNANSSVVALAVSGNKVYAGGAFTRIGGQVQPYFAAVSAVDVPTATLLVRFDAATTNDGIELRWSFGDENRVATVDVERARDVVGPWFPIAPERHEESDVTVALDRTAGELGEYFYRLAVQLADGDRVVFGPVSARYGETPLRNELTLLSPNPTSGGTQLHYGIAREGRVRLEVLDVSGRVVETLADGVQAPGRYVLAWDGVSRGGRPAPGLYFVRLVTPDWVSMSKLAIVR